MKGRDIVSWNNVINKYRRNGYPQEALKLFHQMQRTDLQPNHVTFSSVLSACAKMGALRLGMDIHQIILKRGCFSNVVVATALIDMYTKCGRVHKAIVLFGQMQRTGLQPNQFTFSTVVSACAEIGALKQGMHIHRSIMESGFFSNVVVATALMDFYVKCGSLQKARKVFDKMIQRNDFSWTVMISAYGQNGFFDKALQIFKQMQLVDVKPNSTTFAIILSACAQIGDFRRGTVIHQSIIKSGFISDIIVGNTLIDMYAKCGSIHMSCELFDKMLQRDVISWNAMIAGYAQNGFAEKALETFRKMLLADVKPYSTTFVSILPACAKMGDLEQGMGIHRSIIKIGFCSNVVVASALVDMYAKCGSMDKACKLFEKMPRKDVVSWTTMITGYAQNGFFQKALQNFKQMQLVGVKANSSTFASILPVCAQIGAFELGRIIHQNIIKSGIFSNIIVGNVLVEMYAKCGNMHKACKLFDKMPQRGVVSWNAITAGYAQYGFIQNALETFKQMQLEGVKPNSTTFSSLLPVCAKRGALEQGMNLHQNIIKRGFWLDVVVTNSLINMYAKCGSIRKSCELFDKMLQRDAISWTAMIAGYAQNGFVEKALETFQQMQLTDVKPDSTTFVIILPACTKLRALEQGMCLHQRIIKSGFLSDAIVSSALIDMYAKCGKIHKSRELFDKILERDVVLWTVMIAGYAQNGFVEKALETFKQMLLADVKPDSTTFASILPACAKMGALEQFTELHKA